MKMVVVLLALSNNSLLAVVVEGAAEFLCFLWLAYKLIFA
ncbi:Uncharacterized protein BM_BM1172 [Brugia malayi]|uniref:Bm1172 n=1 Tax=Brugia malayi TaxID=6279 RepID=A0A0K0ISK0_BRUMA|nr:Uncharacterized protein BM_BM1172 [Brugia malayi]CDP92129.1 Bm1172 [Brugia malayi]VIO93064.1 Uncharacterized protein BM_BM1172 [Brugia malayi]